MPDSEEFRRRMEEYTRNMYFDWDAKPISQKRWMELCAQEKHVANDYFHSDKTEDVIHVSTVWLGLNYAFMPDRPPVIFESMAFFGGDWGGEMTDRYSTLDQAKAGHQRMVEQIAELYGPLKKLEAPTTLEEMIEWENYIGGDDGPTKQRSNRRRGKGVDRRGARTDASLRGDALAGKGMADTPRSRESLGMRGGGKAKPLIHNGRKPR